MTSKERSMQKILELNRVEGFEPADFILSDEGGRPILSAYHQMAWFRLKYPKGRIAAVVEQDKTAFVARARVYADVKDEEHQYLAEATVARGYLEDKPEVDPREWAQTAAIAKALTYAGFGLQYTGMKGQLEETARYTPKPREAGKEEPEGKAEREKDDETVDTAGIASAREPAQSGELEQALQFVCPVGTFKGRTLGEILSIDPAFVQWLARKSKDEASKRAARILCEAALQMDVKRTA